MGFSGKEWNLRESSELRLYGYSVSQTEAIPQSDRQALLKQLVDNGLISKQKIIQHLEWLIRTHEYNDQYDNACYKWKKDLQYIND